MFLKLQELTEALPARPRSTRSVQTRASSPRADQHTIAKACLQRAGNLTAGEALGGLSQAAAWPAVL